MRRQPLGQQRLHLLFLARVESVNRLLQPQCRLGLLYDPSELLGQREEIPLGAIVDRDHRRTERTNQRRQRG